MNIQYLVNLVWGPLGNIKFCPSPEVAISPWGRSDPPLRETVMAVMKSTLHTKVQMVEKQGGVREAVLEQELSVLKLKLKFWASDLIL